MRNEGAALLIVHMHRRGHRLLSTPRIVAATWSLCIPRASRPGMLELARRHYRIVGIDELPPCWLAGLLGFLRRHTEPAPKIEEVTIREGVLWAEVVVPTASRDSGVAPELLVPERLNLAIYPSLWRAPRRAHVARLTLERPDLREELSDLPWVEP
jgi:hypothetical protein